LNKIDNLVNLFEKINETDSEEERREKINKFNSGILILNSLSSNCSRIDNSYFLEFLEKIHDKEEQNFFLFLTNLVNDKFFIKPEYRTFENALLNLHQVFTKITQDFQLSENFRDVFVLDEPMKNLNEKIKLYKENKLDKNQINEIYYYAFQYARSDLIKELSQETPELFKEQIFNSSINTRENFLHKILQNDDAESLKLLFNFVNKLEGEEKKIHQGHLKEMFKNSNFVKRLIDFKRVKLFELALDFTEIDFNEPTANNLHPIHIAINSKSYDVLELLLDHRKINKNINFLKQTQIGLEHLNILDYAMSQEETRAFKTILEKNCARELLTSTDENRPDSSFHNIISTDREELLNIFLSKVSCDDLNTLFASYSEQQNNIQGDNLFANLIFYKNKKNLFLIAKKYEKNGKLEEFMDLTLPDKFENVFVANLFLNDQSAENNLLKMLEPELFKNLIKKNSELISKLMVSEVIKTQAISDSTIDFFARPDGAQKRAKKANNLAIFTTLHEKLDEPIKSDLLENIYFEVKKGGEVNMKRSLAKILQQTRGMNAGQDTQHSWSETPSLALTMLEEYLKSDLDSSQKQTKIENLIFSLNEDELTELIDQIKVLERFNEIEPNLNEKTKKLIKIYATEIAKFNMSLIVNDFSRSYNETPNPPQRSIKLLNLASSINLNESDNEFTKLCNEFLDSENPKIKKNQLKFIKDFMSIESAMDPEKLKEQITNEYAPDDDRMKAEFRIKMNEVISTFSITSSSPRPRLSERMSLDLSEQRT
ncbi:MAG: hypothetical protein ACO26G_04560, partial [Rickettsiales bacterium]